MILCQTFIERCEFSHGGASNDVLQRAYKRLGVALLNNINLYLAYGLVSNPPYTKTYKDFKVVCIEPCGFIMYPDYVFRQVDVYFIPQT